MINKYQEALIKLVSNNYSTRSEKNEYINTLLELVNKETPMKVNKNNYITCDCIDDDYDYFPISIHHYSCPNKKCRFHKGYEICFEEKRCPECNQLLDWR